MKTTIYDVLIPRENEWTIKENTVRFELDNGDCFIVENKGNKIDVKCVSNRGSEQIHVLPKVANVVEIKNYLTK